MGIRYENLDGKTRQFMEEELHQDIERGSLYVSPRLTDGGRPAWPGLLGQAIQQHDDDWLAGQLRARGLIRETEQRRKPKGGYTNARVPITAPETLAEGEFNRFYARGLCARALSEGVSEVLVYRGKVVAHPRPESEAKIGLRVSASALLNDLRVSEGVEPALGIPPGPNSGLTVRLP